jgi:hypothetical protein
MLAATAAMAGCGGDGAGKRRDAIDAYVRAANRIAATARPALREEAVALQTFNLSDPDPEQDRRLAAAAVALASARAELRRTEPPPEAARLHRDLLVLYGREAELAGEVRTLARFVAATQRTLDRARSAEAAASAATPLTPGDVAAAGRRYLGVAEALARQTPPRALRAWRDEQMRWLRGVAAEATRLAAALRARDASAAAIQIERYRRTVANRPGVTAAQRRGLMAYNERVRSVARLRNRVAVELADLDRTVR